ncbi:LuxE/PaaK family acyltransferase [Spirosoma validum]|uniref:Acyl transferase n=1 Tax=Spirosoma validum TaxID=2771355 RepID=A0A927GCD5_9BACT|nr:acyl transferase [Spirosoma validum]MBD2752410.1 acyl transferase [Spirosoma validum]
MSFLLTLSPEAQLLRQALRQQILTLSRHFHDPRTFESLALAVFRYQALYNPVYSNYLHHLNVRAEQITDLRRVPFMPISFFKNHTVLTGADINSFDTLTFASSGTTGEQTSRHYVPDPALYDAISTQIFEQTYGSLRDFHILALLPSYLERNNSSLVYMVQRFMDQNDSDESGFFLHNHQELTERLRRLSQKSDAKKILLIGVTFGLLDWAESGQDLSFLGQLPNLIVMETGGMKGRRKELLREEVHEILMSRLGIQTVHSEYGMTELLSQAYSHGKGVFQPSSTLRVFLRDINDPFLIYPDNYTRTGGINVVDLANLDSCSFIETQDLGQYVDEEANFRVIGRFDNSDVRGCNLMIL